MRTAPVGSVSDHRAEHRTTKCPESLCRMSALPPSERRVPPPARTLLLGHGSYRLIRQSRTALPYFGLSLVRAVSAGCYQSLLPAGLSRRYLCESFPGCMGPCHGGFTECICFSASPSSAFPRTLSRSASRLSPSKRFHDGSLFRDCSHFVMFRPPSLLASQIVPTAATYRRRAAEALRPSRTCVVTSACIGYANHPPRQL